MTKEQIRRDMKQKRNNMLLQERKVRDKEIHKILFQSEEYRSCGQLFAYVSFGSEIDTYSIIKRAFKDQKRVYVPRVSGASIDFFWIKSMDGLTAGSFGVPEPLPQEDMKYLREKDPAAAVKKLMLLPGLAFDCRGRRTGYGRGYYDKYLAGYPAGYFYKVAMAYDFQIFDKLPFNKYDISADAVITPQGYEFYHLWDQKLRGGTV